MTGASQSSPDRLRQATALILLAAMLTILPVIAISADHLIRQRSGLKRQAAVSSAIGLTGPCLFPAGHPARTRLDNASAIDWRLAPALPQSVPGPLDLVRPSGPIGGRSEDGY